MEYVIVDAAGLYWSNNDGWVSNLADATRFTLHERNTLNLPMGGDWLDIEQARARPAPQD